MSRRPLDRQLLYSLGAGIHLRAVRKLKSTHMGAFVWIALAVLDEGFDPFTAGPSALQFYGRATPLQWMKIKGDVLAALQVAIPVMEAMYQKRVKVKKKHIEVLEEYREKERVRKLLKKEEEQGVKLFADSSTLASGILQPQKAQRFSPNKVDGHLRQPALESRKSPDLVGGLHD